MERIENLIPERIRSLSGRKIYGILFGLLGFFLMLCVVFGALVGLKHKEGVVSGTPHAAASVQGRAELCKESMCLKTSSWMLHSMKPSVDPCDNFYQYACGNWVERKIVPSDWSRYSVISEMWHTMYNRLDNLLRSSISDRRPESVERKLKQFYQTCLHEQGRMRDGGKHIIEIIRNHLGGWYALNPVNWQADTWDISENVATAISDYMVAALLSVNVYPKQSRGMITIEYAYRGFEDASEDAYRTYIGDLGRLLLRDANVSVNEAALQQFIDDAYYQEKHIDQHLQALRQRDDFNDSPVTTVREMTANFTQFNWIRILRAYFGPSVTLDTQVFLRNRPYFVMLDQLLRNETTNKQRIMNNYLIYCFADQFAYHLSFDYKYALYKFLDVVYGFQVDFGHDEGCLYILAYHMPLALMSQYIKDHVNSTSLSQVRKLFLDIKSLYSEQILNTSWIDAASREKIKGKLSSMDAMVGFPEEFLDQTFLEEIHQDLTINSTQGYFKNFLSIVQFIKKTLLMEIQSGTKYFQWHFVLHEGAFGVKPDYFFDENHIYIPPASFQFPMFSSKQPRFSMLGGMGMAVASAVFDDIRVMGMHGRLQDHSWTNQTKVSYNKLEMCFRNHTKNITMGPYNVDGQQRTVKVKPRSFRTVIRDSAALKVMNTFYLKQLISNGPEPQPPGLNLTSQQALFVAAAQGYCSKFRDKDLYRRTRGGLMPTEVKVNLMMSHSMEFSTAFRCPSNAKMNPVDKCNVI